MTLKSAGMPRRLVVTVATIHALSARKGCKISKFFRLCQACVHGSIACMCRSACNIERRHQQVGQDRYDRANCGARLQERERLLNLRQAREWLT